MPTAYRRRDVRTGGTVRRWAVRALVRHTLAPCALALASTLALSALAPLALNAQQRSLRIEHFDARYSIARSGDVHVTEKLRARFTGEWNGVERVLVQRVADGDTLGADPTRGSFRRTTIDVHDATNTTGAPLRTETDRSGETLTVRAWVPGARDATRTVVFNYTIRDGVSFFDDSDQFYWNVTGTEWRIPIDSVDVLVALPQGAQPDSVLVFAGAAGTTDDAAIARVVEGGVIASSNAPLPPGHGLTIALRWPAGIVERPDALESVGDWLGRMWPFALPLLSFGVMWTLWKRRGRDPAQRPVAAQYEVPDELSPGEVGTVLDERADLRDITATLVDMAVRGYIRIDEIVGTKVLGFEVGEDYRFVELRTDTRDLLPHERLLLSSLFDKGGSIELSDLKNEFYKDLPAIRDAMMDQLTKRGFYGRRPDKVRKIFFGIGAAVLALSMVAGSVFAASLGGLAMLIAPLTVAPIVLFGWFMPRRTVRGARSLERVLGFREFVARVDGDRLRRMNVAPDMFEKLLPFAMAMGEEKRWATAFEGIYQQPPNWYHGAPGRSFSTIGFVSDLGQMSARTGSTMTSSPGGGGSGFSGGSVGGGGGGGGGGGF